MVEYPHEKLHAEFLVAIDESGLTDHGLGNYWSAELDIDPGAATSKVRRWRKAFPGPVIAFVCFMDMLGWRVKLEKKFDKVLPIRDLIV
jgi:hypothetical protein